jgi:hypothetical protein
MIGVLRAVVGAFASVRPTVIGPCVGVLHRLASVAILAALVTGCSSKVLQAGGLELILETNMKQGTAFDSITVDIQEEQGEAGTFRTLTDVSIPVQMGTLPGTVSIAAGKSGNEVALITITAMLGNAPVLDRVIEVQVPEDRVAELVVLLSSNCAGQLHTTCPDPQTESCQPASGTCGADSVNASTLPPYSPNDFEAGMPDATVEAGPAAPPDATAETGSEEAAPDGTAPGDASAEPDVVPIGPTCTPGGSCAFSSCQSGSYVCEDGGRVCSPIATELIEAGTACSQPDEAGVAVDAGTATFVCNAAGACVACNAGGDCSDPTLPCIRKAYACSSGVATCQTVGDAVEGSSCGTGVYCYGGVCSTCTVGAACAPATNPCHLGSVTACTAGVPTCTDQTTNAAAGKACETATVPSGVCDGAGNCVSCTPNALCTPTGNTCRSGTMSCSSGPDCVAGNAVNQGKPCGTGKVCSDGTCVACGAASCPDGCCNADGCVAAETTAECGLGGVACSTCPPPAMDGVAACVTATGTCAVTCNAGYHACSGACAANTSVNTCGASCTPCALANAASACTNGACAIATCNPGFGNCNGLASDGCETPLDTNTNCAGCNVACTQPNATATCATGVCAIATCDAGYHICSGACASSTSVNTCGASCTPCALSNATSACTNGACAIATCDPGFGNCNGLASDGCETPLDTNANCAGCNVACTQPNATATCATGVCAIAACDAGYHICSGACASSTSVNTCGTLCTPCALANATSACTDGACAVATCDPGFGNCNGLASDGCEANLLTSSTNCGACQHNCLGGECLDGECQPIAIVPATAQPTALTSDGTQVMWTNSAGAVQGVKVTGGTTWTLGSATNASPYITNDGTYTYWANNLACADPLLGSAAVLSALDTGGPATTQWSIENCGVPVTMQSVLATGANLYSVLFNPIVGECGATLYFQPLQMPSATPPPAFTTGPCVPKGLAADATNIYWTDLGTGAVMAEPLAGGTPTSLAAAVSPLGIGVAGGYVYWTDNVSDVLQRVATSLATTAQTLESTTAPGPLYVDGTNVYWIDSSGVERAPVAGGTVVTVGVGQTPVAIAGDATAVYWANQGTGAGNGSIQRLRKP